MAGSKLGMLIGRASVSRFNQDFKAHFLLLRLMPIYDTFYIYNLRLFVVIFSCFSRSLHPDSRHVIVFSHTISSSMHNRTTTATRRQIIMIHDINRETTLLNLLSSTHSHLFQSFHKLGILLLQSVNIVVILRVKLLLILLVFRVELLCLSPTVDFRSNEPTSSETHQCTSHSTATVYK